MINENFIFAIQSLSSRFNQIESLNAALSDMSLSFGVNEFDADLVKRQQRLERMIEKESDAFRTDWAVLNKSIERSDFPEFSSDFILWDEV